MSDLLPRITVGVDLLGFALTLWLGLFLLAHGWGWQRARLHAALALWGLALVFALGLYDWLAPLTGASSTLAVLRLLLLPFPLGWFMLARRLAPGVVLTSARATTVLVLAATLGTAAMNILTGIVLPEWLPRSWLYLPAYGLTLLLTMGATVSLALSARAATSSALERRAMAALVAGSWLALIGGALLATDWVLGLSNALLPDLVTRLAEPLRLVGSVSLMAASGALMATLRAQAQAEGARLLNLAPSLAAMLVLAAVFLAVGGWAVWYWQLPMPLLALFLLLALVTEGLLTMAGAALGRMARRPTGKLRQQLLTVAERLDDPEEVPPAVRPLLSRLARQVHSPQLGLAIRDEKGFRVVAALRPSWEGATIDVPHPDVWEERALGGWNKPVKLNGQTIGVIASDPTGPLNPVQVRLLDQAAAEIVQLISEWREAARKREALQKALTDYQQHSDALQSRFAALASPLSVGGGFERGVQQVLQQYKETVAVGRHPLATLKLVEASAGPSGGKSIEARGQVLQQTLASLIEQLRPLEGEPPTMPTPEWHPYLILKWVYLQGIGPDEVMARLYLKSGGYNRAHRAAIAAVARMLAELEAGVRRAAPKPGTVSATPSTLPTPNAARPALASPGSPPAGLSGTAPTVASAPPPAPPMPVNQPPPAAPAPPPRSSLRDFASRVRGNDEARRDNAPAQPAATPAPADGATRRLPAFAKGSLAARFAGTANRFGAAKPEKQERTANEASTPPAPPPAPPFTTMPLASPPSHMNDSPARAFTRPVPKPSEKEEEEKKPEESDPPPDWDGT